MKKIIRLIALLFTAFAPASAQQTADTIYYNGKIVTMWDAHPVVEAVAIRGNKFTRVGTSTEVLQTAGPQTQKIDLKGQCVLPGLQDSHTHPITAALSEQEETLPALNSIADIQAYIRRRAQVLPLDRLIFVPKIFVTRLKEHRYPTRYELDGAATGRAVVVDNGYASVLNTFLLNKLGVDRDTPQPSDGRIVKDEKGEPTGLILGASQLLSDVRRQRPITASDQLWALKSMQKSYNSVGITSTIDRGEGPDGFRAYEELHKKGGLTVRSYITYLIGAQGTPQQVKQDIERIPFVTGWGDDWFRVGPLKTIMDGGILIGTAYLREPYGVRTEMYGFVEPNYRGVLAVPRENVLEMARTADALNWQMTAHTTGGGSLDILLDAYEAANREKPIKDLRFTVTHGNFPDQRAIERASKLGVSFDCQPAWLYLDGSVIKNVFGPERMSHFIPLRSLFDAGIVVAGGSDHMIRFDPRNSINPYHPFFGMWMAVTRKTIDGTILNPEQRISRGEALRMWTLNGAYLTFEEKVKGSIEPGKLADMIVATKDYLTCPEDEIKDIEVSLTVVGGKVVYRK